MGSSSARVRPASLVIAATRRALPRIWWALPATLGLAITGFGLASPP